MSIERTPPNDTLPSDILSGDKAFWQSLATGSQGAPVRAADMDFAAWLEGRLTEAEAARFEAAVAADPALRRAALELADILDGPLPVAPERLVVRARSLVGFEAERPTSGSLLGRLFPSGLRRAVLRAAMGMAALVIASGGFVVGGGLGASFAQGRYDSSATAATSSDTSNEMNEFFASDGI